MTTWREMFLEDMKVNGDSWDNVVFCTLSQEQLDADERRLAVPADEIVAWTAKYVYYGIDLDWTNDCSFQLRNPPKKRGQRND